MICSFLISFVIVYLCEASDDVPSSFENDFSLTKPFHQQYSWDIAGSTMITDKFIRLTSDVPSQHGSMWSKHPLRKPFWELIMTFRVHGKGKTLFGDGFAMWYTQDRMMAGPVFGSKNGFRGFGVFFDTYSNHQGEHNHAHPYLSAMVSNGSLLYDHDSDGTHTQLEGCHFPFRNSHNDVAVKVRYLDDTLSVFTDLENADTWKPCFDSERVILPTNYYFGLSSVTGDLSDNHDVTSFKIFTLTSRSNPTKERNPFRLMPQAAKFDAPRQRVESSESMVSSTLRSPVKTFLISVVIIVGAVFLIAVGYIYYKDKEEKRLKRFY